MSTHDSSGQKARDGSTYRPLSNLESNRRDFLWAVLALDGDPVTFTDALEFYRMEFGELPDSTAHDVLSDLEDEGLVRVTLFKKHNRVTITTPGREALLSRLAWTTQALEGKHP